MACLPNNNTRISNKKNLFWQALSQMEEEHLITRAAIPYRDPDKTDASQTILKRRKTEQSACGLEATSTWQKRWGLGKKQ